MPHKSWLADVVLSKIHQWPGPLRPVGVSGGWLMCRGLLTPAYAASLMAIETWHLS